MVDTPVVEGTEYITKADLDAVMDEFYRRVDSRLNQFEKSLHGVRKDVDDKIENVRSEVSQKIASSQSDSIHQMEGMLDKRIEDEAIQRKKDVQVVEEQVKAISDDTHSQLEELDKRLMSKVDRILGKLDGWSDKMEANQRLYDENRDTLRDQSKKLEEFEHGMDSVKSQQQSLTERQEVIRRTIHGGTGEDGPPSIYSMLSEIKSGVEEVKGVAVSNSSRLEKIEEKQAADEQKWANRWETVKVYTTNKYSLVAIIVIIIIVAVTIRPENQNFFLQGIGDIFKFFSGT